MLVVDDDQQILRALRTSLKARGHEIRTAANGETALDLLTRERFDVVVLDLGLPGIDGTEVIRRVRGWSDVPIIVLSVRERQEDKVAALDAGADDYVTKPFAMEELLARMRAVRRRSSAEPLRAVARAAQQTPAGSWIQARLSTEALPEQVMAPAGLLSAWIVYGQPTAETPGFHSGFFNAGGMGAGARTDGVSTCIYPSSASTVPVELFEVAVPMLVQEKALITDSGGAGRQRGGLGQRVTLSLLPGFEGTATVSMWVHGRNIAPFGLHGGHAAQPTSAEVDGAVVDTSDGRGRLSGLTVAHHETTLTQCTAGGGGFGRPEERDPMQVIEDVRDGYVSREQAVAVYGLPEDEAQAAAQP